MKINELKKMVLPTLVYYLLPATLILIAVRKYRESKWGKCRNNVKLTGKVAIVTGANSGIGFEIAKNLASREAKVILACRNLTTADESIKKIKSNINTALLVPMQVDLTSLNSIKTFADNIKKSYKQIDLLINNAGVSYPKDLKKETEDGYEIHFGVNHLGHFLLTNLLLDIIKNGRIVIVSSLLHEKGRIYLEDLSSVNCNGNLYANSKLANVYFCRELAKRLESSGSNVYAVCPGWVYTGLFRYHKWKLYHYIFIAPIAFLFMRSAKQGSQTAIYCATETDLNNESGQIYRDCKKYQSKLEFDDVTGTKLWELSEKMIKEKGINF